MYISRKLLVAALLVSVVSLAPSGHAQEMQVIGYGQHTEGPTKVLVLPSGPVSVGTLTANFAVTENSAMCSVGNYGGQISQFNMLVYATEVTDRLWNREADNSPCPTACLTLKGTARSLTIVNSIVVEDVETPFSATALDGSSSAPSMRDGDYFHMSIDTVLWPHTTFGKDIEGKPLPLFSGDVAIGRNIARSGES